MKLVASLTLFLMLGCGGKSTPSNTIDLSPQDWHLQWNNLTSPITGISPIIWNFNFPNNPTDVYSYVTVPYHAVSSIEGKTITMTFEVVSSNAEYSLYDTTTYGPAQLHLYLQRTGDDYSGTGEMQYYRWWCGSASYVFGSADNTVVTVSCPLTYTNWSSVQGAEDQTEFEATLNNLQRVGFTLGGANGWGHGLYLTSGSSEFELLSFSIQ